MKITQEIPQAQKDIVVAALKQRQQELKSINEDVRDQNEEDELYDLYALIGFFSYKVTVELSVTEEKQFSHNHSVDFPQFIV